MSFGSGNTANIAKAKPKLLGLDDLRASTAEQGRPIPYVAGTQRIGVTFISQGLGFKATQGSSGGKPKGGGNSAGSSLPSYTATWAAAICHGSAGPFLGALETIHEIWMDDEQVWVGPLDRYTGGEDSTHHNDYADITIEGRGNVRIYWGTYRQEIDPTLAAYTSIEAHPAYKFLSYLVFTDFSLGPSATAPNTEVIVTRRPVVPGWFAPNPAIALDVNPALVIYELLTAARFGLGLPDSRIDLDSLNAIGETLAEEGFGISVVLTTQMTLREAVIRVLENFDGYFRVIPNGKISFGLVRATPTATVVPVLSEADVIDEPEIDTGSWAETASGAQVKFTNAQRYWKEDVVTVEDPANIAITGETKLPVLDRTWITDPVVAERAAGVLAQRGGFPQGLVRLSARRSSVVNLQPGDVVKFFWAQLGIQNLRLRVNSIQLPKAGEQSADVALEIDRGLLNTSYGGIPIYVPPAVDVITPTVATFAAAIQLPALATEGDDPQVVFLIAAPTTHDDQWWAWHQMPDSSFEQVGLGSSEFAIVVRIDLSFPIFDTPHPSFWFPVTVQVPDSTMNRFSAGDIAAGRIWMSNGTEWIQILSATLIAPHQYRLTALRSRFGTAQEARLTGDLVFLFNFHTMTRYTVATPGSGTHTFKLQPGVLGRRSELGSATALSVAIDRSVVTPPSPLNLRVDSEHRSPRWAGATDLLVSWDAAAKPTLELFDRWEATNIDAAGVLLDVLDSGPVIVATIMVAPGQTSHVLVYADLVTALGGSPASFTVQVRHQAGGKNSQPPTRLDVTRI